MGGRNEVVVTNWLSSRMAGNTQWVVRAKQPNGTSNIPMTGSVFAHDTGSFPPVGHENTISGRENNDRRNKRKLKSFAMPIPN